MIQFAFNPPLQSATDGPLIQTITMSDDLEPIGQAAWSAPALADGVIQLLSLAIVPIHRRRRHGSKLLAALIEQGRLHCAGRNLKLRQLWCGVEQKTQVDARAFLMHNNFHHVATIQDLLKGQDLLIYKKSLR